MTVLNHELRQWLIWVALDRSRLSCYSVFYFICITQIFCEEIDDDEVGEALRRDIIDNPLDIYMRVG